MQPEMSKSRPDFTLLTLLRFFAAFGVVAYHLGMSALNSSPNPGFLHRNPIFGCGFLGVTFFYVLSGFILGTLYPSVKNKRDFYLKRFLRIYPSYFVILAILVACPFFVFPRTLSYCGPVFLLYHAWVPSQSQNLLGPAWSLSCEAFFYLIFPLATSLVTRVSKVGAGVIIGLTFVTTIGCLVSLKFGLTFEDIRVSKLVFFPLVHLPSFLVGILFSRFKRVPGRSLIAVISCMVFVLLAKLIFRDPIPLMMGLAALPFAAVIWAVAGEKQLNPDSRLTSLLLLLGNASYVLYLAHWPILEIFYRTGHLNSNLQDLAALLTTVAFSVVFYLLIDGPLHVAGLRWIKRRSVAEPGV